ncbi:probable DNA excision repair protein ERCC-8 [Rhynchosporium secalis]|uniref:Probable DNA excision repair protein ERCC-8 n=1 Tax=Rhynchosporium secalis TaxID=38038 RepID=A0A1E1M8H3_RHYSE|nr:probable DNA excision repair protein ERCC-8 [Rhynchosporium secalis]
MNQLLFDRSTGILGPQAFARHQTSHRIHSVQPAPRLRFNGGEKEAVLVDEDEEDTFGPIAPPVAVTEGTESKIWAHQSGVNSLAIDVDNRLLLSGGAESAIKVWDLDENDPGAKHTFKPSSVVPKTSLTHKFGITQLNFFPFDSGAFLSSSYDHHLKIYSADTLAVSGDFDLNSIVYTHALSPIASHLLVACATQHPAVRLVDLRSGSSTHSLAGHHGALLCLAWSPTIDYILASGSIDGTVRLWDIRKSSGALGVLDMEDSTGTVGTDGLGKGARSRDSGKSHSAAVNGLAWTGDGSYIISAGHDDRIRVWDTATGANTLASFGPTLKNCHLSSLPLVVSPPGTTSPKKDLLFFPNEREILVFELHEGRLLKRLKVPGPINASVRSRTGERNIKGRVTALTWRGLAGGLYSSHTDGNIRAWLPRTAEDDELDEDEESLFTRDEDNENEGAKRKRKVLDDVFRDLTRQKISFG